MPMDFYGFMIFNGKTNAEKGPNFGKPEFLEDEIWNMDTRGSLAPFKPLDSFLYRVPNFWDEGK